MIRIVYPILLLTFILSEGMAQEPVQIHGPSSGHQLHWTYRMMVDQGTLYDLQLPSQVTGMTLEAADDFTGEIYVKAFKDSLPLRHDSHSQAKELSYMSNLLSFDQAIDSCLFFTGNLSGEVVFHFYNVSGGFQRKINNSRKPVDTASLNFIDQSEWREGLPLKDQPRTFTTVKHVIIHHSATSNNLDNSFNTVRNIYLLHTENNGWDDIGYNYLIDKEGHIFKGRDPYEGEQDNVMGAHFCGNNATTMGVCVLGTYTSTVPTDAAMQSLRDLTAWKLDKESLGAFETYTHPTNSKLGTIAGHRNGCSTECPGGELYASLPVLRIEVNDILNPMEVLGDQSLANKVLVMYNPYNPDECYISLSEVKQALLTGVDGKKYSLSFSHQMDKQTTLHVQDVPNGIYLLSVVDANNREYRQKIRVF